VIERDQTAERTARRRFWRAAAIGGLFAAPALYWMVNAGQLNPFHAGLLGDFYDTQAHSLLELRWDVPAKEVGLEGFRIDDKTYLYFGPVPALLRMPILAFTHSLDGRLTQVSMLTAFAVALVFIARLSWRIRRLVRGDAPVTRVELWAVGGYMFLIATGSVMFFLASRAHVYHETELWAAALALAAYDAILAFLCEPSRRWILLAGVWSTLAFLTRATVGAGPVIALAMIFAVVVLRRIGSGGLGAPARWLGVPDTAGTNRMIAWLATAVAVAVVLYAYVNYARFGTFFDVPFEKQVFSQSNVHRQRALADNGGSLFGAKFVPTQLLQVLRPDALRFHSLFPWVTFPGPATVIGDVTFDTRHWSSSIPASMPAFAFLALGGVVVAARRAGAAVVRAPLIAGAIGGLATFTIAYVANRYMSDLMPAIALASLLGLHALLAAWLGASHARWTRIAVVALVVLAVVSLWMNFALAIMFQRALDPTIEAQVTGFVAFQQDVDDRLPAGPRGTVRSVDELPKPGSLGELLIVRNCAGLYWSDSYQWRALERAHAAGHFRMRLRFPAARSGEEPLVGFGAGMDQNVLSVRYVPDDEARFVIDSRVLPEPIVSDPRRLESDRTYMIEVVLDNLIGVVRVTLDGHVVLEPLIPLVKGDQATIGAAADPNNAARFSGTIRELPVRTPLCDFVRSRYRVGSRS
jgi:hypothetical protein